MSKTPSTSQPDPTFRDFKFDDSVALWNLPAREWLLENHKQDEWDGLATASVVFNPEGKVLVLQRASHDSMPNKWELPGGAVDDDDATILHGAARELLEEAGLVAQRVAAVIVSGGGGLRDQSSAAGQVIRSRTRTQTWCRFTFRVDVECCNLVRLDPNEHQDYAWASEKEVREEKLEVDGREMPITHEAVKGTIIEAFRLKEERIGKL